MPDIGLLQGPPPKRAIAVQEPETLRAAAHSAVVSDAPIAVRSAVFWPEPAAERVAAPIAGPVVEQVVEPAFATAIEPAIEPLVEPLLDQAPSPAREQTPAAAPMPVAEEPPREATVSSAPAPASASSSASASSTSSTSPSSTSQIAPIPPAARAAFPPIRVSDLLWLLLAVALIIGTGLGIRDPWPADEPRFASLARDMLHSGEWLFPRVGGDLYQDKPPLFFWLLAGCYALFGAFRGWFLIPAFLATAGVVFLIYDFGRRTVSREAGLGAALAVLCTLHFVMTMRGAQIDPVLCLLTTLSCYALLRHLLLGDGWRWYWFGSLCAGLGVITKGVGFLPMLLLIPYFLMRARGWQGLATPDGGRAGWRWWLGPVAMLLGISLWFVPMLLAVAASGSPDYIAYRDEILFKQTVGRYAAAWHHVKGWYYFLVEVIPPLWLPWSILLFWLAPGFRKSFQQREARVWLPLSWVFLVLLFFSISPGKRGVYVLPALPLLAIASLPLLPEVLARPGVRRAGWVLALAFWLAGLLALVAHAFDWFGHSADEAIGALPVDAMLVAFLVLAATGLLWARARAPLAAWPATLAALCIAFSGFLAPHMNGERSGRDFVVGTLAQVQPSEQLGLVAYKEQFLLYLDRPVVNFGHRRWQEGAQEYFDAAAWLNAGPQRVLLVPEEALVAKDRFKPEQPAIPCFTAQVQRAGVASDDHWFLVRAPAEAGCAARGNAGRAIHYVPATLR